MQHYLRGISLFGLVGLMTILPGCGGGGGGGGGIAPSSIQYAGVTTQALVDQNNAVELATASLQGGKMGSAVLKPGTGGGTPDPSNGLGLSNISDALRNAIQGGITPSSSSLSGGIARSKSGSVNETGPCGGTASGTINVNEVTGSFSGTFTFSKYCSEGVYVSGAVSATGTIDLSTNTIETLQLTFTILHATSGSQSIALSGSISFNVASPVTTLTVAIVLRDDNTLLLFQADYSVTETEGVGYVDSMMSGRFYHTLYGYVELSTEVPFRILAGDNRPSSGVLTATGAGGTKAQLTALSSPRSWSKRIWMETGCTVNPRTTPHRPCIGPITESIEGISGRIYNRRRKKAAILRGSGGWLPCYTIFSGPREGLFPLDGGAERSDDPQDVRGVMIHGGDLGNTAGRFGRRDAGVAGRNPSENRLGACRPLFQSRL